MRFKTLADLIFSNFNMDELRSLCMELDFDHESLPQDTKNAFARELVRYCNRRGWLYKLCIKCQELRPHVEWPCSNVKEAKSNQPADILSVSTYLRDVSQDESRKNRIPTITSSTSRQSEVSIPDLSQLNTLLSTRKWRLADQETIRLILSFRKRKEKTLNLLNPKDIEASRELIRLIDEQWRSYSKEKFGFSIQNQILQKISNGYKYEVGDLREFCQKVGWPIEGFKMQLLENFSVDEDLPPGHLPKLHLPEYERNDGFLAWKDNFVVLMKLFGLPYLSYDD